jgi:molybdopterin/thiamine biosynthesis adenylyltransferase/rhodanese-related sulfurtransferase
MNLTPEQLTRYSRHFILPEIGEEGQKKILQSKVLLIGTGGLGSPLGLYLAAAGVGTLGLVDFDNVDLSNLQRQIIHTNDEVGKPKIDSAEKRIKAMNPDTKVIKYPVKITSANALDIIRDYDVVIDGTDNFPTRYLTNDACVFLKKPNIYGSIFRFDGLTTVFSTKDGGPCYRCLYPEPPPPGMVPSCAEGGVLGVLPGVIGLIQATEAIKLIVGIGKPLIGRLMVYDALQMTFRELKIRKDPACPVCGKNPTVTKLIDYEQFCGLGRGSAQTNTGVEEISVRDLKGMLDAKEDFVFIDVRENFEYQIAHLPKAQLIPLAALERHLPELEAFKSKTIVAHCHHGGRSRRALEFLRSKGFSKLKNVAGGIDAWSLEVDPTLPRY